MGLWGALFLLGFIFASSGVLEEAVVPGCCTLGSDGCTAQIEKRTVAADAPQIPDERLEVIAQGLAVRLLDRSHWVQVVGNTSHWAAWMSVKSTLTPESVFRGLRDARETLSLCHARDVIVTGWTPTLLRCRGETFDASAVNRSAVHEYVAVSTNPCA